MLKKAGPDARGKIALLRGLGRERRCCLAAGRADGWQCERAAMAMTLELIPIRKLCSPLTHPSFQSCR